MVYVCVHLGMGAQIAHQLLVTQIAWLVNAMVPPLLIVHCAILLLNYSVKYPILWLIYVSALIIIISME